MAKLLYSTYLSRDYYHFQTRRYLRHDFEDPQDYRIYLPADFAKDYSVLLDNTDIEWSVTLGHYFSGDYGHIKQGKEVSDGYSSSHEMYNYAYSAYVYNVKGSYYFKIPSEFVSYLHEADKYMEYNWSSRRNDFKTIDEVQWFVFLSTVDKSHVDSALVNFTKGM